MLSIYQKDIVEKICKEYCDGVEENGKTIKTGMQLLGIEVPERM